MAKINRNEFLSEIYERNFAEGVSVYLSNAEFKKSIYPYSENGYEGPDILAETTGGLFEYRLNRDGFIGNDFVNNPDILALGCSATAGVGLKTSYTWPRLISEKTGLTVNQVGLLGASIPQLVSLFFDISRIHGKPKYLFLLVPELTRHWMYQESETARSRHYFDTRYNSFRCFDKNSTLKIDSDSFNIDFRIVAHNSFIQLTAIADACRLLGIEYRFFSWMNDDNFLFEKFNFYGYAPELKEIPAPGSYEKQYLNSENEQYWLLGMDGTHSGVVEHYYYRDRFLESVNL